MKIKWSVVVLVIFGVLAALFASLLVSALRSGGGPDDSVVEVVVAERSLPAMFVIGARHIAKEEAAVDELPEGYLTDPVQAVGKVLSVRVVEGQVLTKYCFVTEGSGAQLASALPYGMRAVSIPVAGHSLMGGLLHPGCVVDVVATFKLRSSKETEGQAISTTLLHGVQVLAVEATSIVSKPELGEETTRRQKATGAGGRLTVTLMVDTRQAEALQLAMENGHISLAMRNPLDRRPVAIDATVLSQGRLAKLGSLLGTSVPTAHEDIGWEQAGGIVTMAADSDDPNSVFPRQAGSSAQLRGFLSGAWPAEGAEAKRQSSQWEVTVIRGREVKEEVLDISGDEDSAAQKTEEEGEEEEE